MAAIRHGRLGRWQNVADHPHRGGRVFCECASNDRLCCVRAQPVRGWWQWCDSYSCPKSHGAQQQLCAHAGLKCVIWDTPFDVQISPNSHSAGTAPGAHSVLCTGMLGGLQAEHASGVIACVRACVRAWAVIYVIDLTKAADESARQLALWRSRVEASCASTGCTIVCDLA